MFKTRIMRSHEKRISRLPLSLGWKGGSSPLEREGQRIYYWSFAFGFSALPIGYFGLALIEASLGIGNCMLPALYLLSGLGLALGYVAIAATRDVPGRKALYQDSQTSSALSDLKNRFRLVVLLIVSVIYWLLGFAFEPPAGIKMCFSATYLAPGIIIVAVLWLAMDSARWRRRMEQRAQGSP